jgi:hypothetical protein
LTAFHTMSGGDENEDIWMPDVPGCRMPVTKNDVMTGALIAVLLPIRGPGPTARNRTIESE